MGAQSWIIMVVIRSCDKSVELFLKNGTSALSILAEPSMEILLYLTIEKPPTLEALLG